MVLCLVGLMLGESVLTLAQYRQALQDPGSPPGEVIWTIRAPRVLMAALIGGSLGLAGATLQGLLRNPLADPGVLGVSAFAGLGAAASIVLGLASIAGAVELGALAGAGLAGTLVL